MKNARAVFVEAFLVATLLVGVSTAVSKCAPTPSMPTPYTPGPTIALQVPSGTLVIWHGWEESAKLALDGVISPYLDLRKNVKVEARQVSVEKLLNQYVQAALSDDAPDLVIGPASWVQTLAEAELITSLDELVPPPLMGTVPESSLDALRYKEKLYGFPATIGALASVEHKGGFAEPQAFMFNPRMKEESKTLAIDLITYIAFGYPP